MHEENKITAEKIKEILLNSEYAVFFGGAGVSTGSGIPDFRGENGLYRSEDESIEYYLSRHCLIREPDKFFEFFKNNMFFENFEPNNTHFALAELEKRGIIKAVITQNIDGLHQKAGSERVIEVHGTAKKFYCVSCGKEYSSEILFEQDGIPRCDVCGALVRPDVTLYGEPLEGSSYTAAEEEIYQADVLIVGGSSLSVEPAASLVDMFTGEHLIVINYSPTKYDGVAEYVIRDSLSDVFTYLTEE